MANVTKHDSKKERENGDSKKGRVDFFVSGYTIGVNNFLERSGKIVDLKVSGGFFVSCGLSHGDDMG